MYSDTGRIPLFTRCLARILNYKRKLDSVTNNPLLKAAYKMTQDLADLGYKSWMSKYSCITQKIPFAVPEPLTLKSHHIKTNLALDFKNKWLNSISNETDSPKLRTYQLFKRNLKFEPYLSLVPFDSAVLFCLESQT